MANASKRETPKETCLIDGCDGSKKLIRGLCQKHYTQFKRQIDSIEESNREAFEAKLVEKGQLLPAKTPGKKSEYNPFADLAHEMGLAQKPARALDAQAARERVTEAAKTKKKGTK